MWEIIIAGAAAIKVPGLFEAAVRATGEKLLGPVLDSWAQPIKDRTQQRSRISQALADLAAQEIGINPSEYRPAVEHLLLEADDRAGRKKSTFRKALVHLAAGSEDQTERADVPNEDWLNRWARYVEDASSDELQDAFARILAGEISRKGTFSIAVLRIVAEMSPHTAREFQALWSETITDYAIKYPIYNRGDGWLRLLKLRESGLVSFSDASIHRPPNGSLWTFGAGPFLTVEVDPQAYSEVPIMNLTSLGLELGSILPRPDSLANLRKLGLECPDKRGWKQALLVHTRVSSGPAEVVWRAPEA